MSSLPVLYALQAAVRLGGTARQALRERALARPVPLPLPPIDVMDRTNWALTILSDDPRFPQIRRDVFGDAAPAAPDTPEGRAQSEALFEIACDRWRARREQLPAELLETLGDAAAAFDPPSAVGVVYVAQWRNDASPSLSARIGLALFDIALEYAGANPAVFGADARAEPFITALAFNLRAILAPIQNASPGAASPDAEAFAQRAVAVFFRSGLQALQDNPSVYLEEEHVAELATAMLEPLVGLFAEQSTLPSWVRIRETVLGPVSSAAFQTLAERQAAFLGSAFGQDKALGGVTEAFFREVAEHNLDHSFSTGGLSRIYTTLLPAVAENPDLVVKGDGAGGGLGRDMLSGIARALERLPAPYDHATMRAEIAAVALQAVSSQARAAGDAEADPWDRAAARAVSAFVEGVSARAAADGSGFRRVVNRPFMLEMARLVFAEAAETPGMLVGENAGGEVKTLTAATAALLSHEAADLMGRDAWRRVLGAFVAETARNPGVLVPTDARDDPGPVVAGLLRLMDVAEANARAATGATGRRPGAVLFGDTLAGALTAAVRAAAGHPRAAADPAAWAAVGRLAVTLNGLAGVEDGRIGAAEWLWLFRAWVAEAIAGGLGDDATADVVIAPLLTADAGAPLAPAQEAHGEA